MKKVYDTRSVKRNLLQQKQANHKHTQVEVQRKTMCTILLM